MIWSKNAFIVKAGLSFTAFLVACGGDSSNKADPSNCVLREVSTIYDLGACSADRYGDTIFVYEDAVDYLCVNNDWVDITTPIDNQSGIPEKNGLSSYTDEGILSSSSFVDDSIRNDSNSKTTQSINQNYAVVPIKEKLPTCDSGNAKQSVFVQADSILYTCSLKNWEPEKIKGYIVKDASILGAAQKGPFKLKSPLSLSEVLLRNDSLVYSGRKYNGEISSNKGDFIIPKVSLIYPYAVLEVRGQWRNEISGDYSKDSMTLRVLTDLSKRTEVNINLLTHLEYDRAVKLVNTGYNVYAAKTQAEHEIMTAFGFATTVEYSEDMKTFVPSTNTTHNANATLMAISLLFIADKNDADIQKSINDFRNDFAEDGSWDNEQMKANMADWAESFDGSSVHANVKKWNILDIPKYENFLTIFWNNAYGLGGCDHTRYGDVLQVSNKSSKNYEVHYICKENGWIKASDYEKDTYGWTEGRMGELKKGNLTDAIYVYNGSKWEFAERENSIGICGESNAGEVSIYDGIYYICKNNAWKNATELEYDTYGLIGVEGDVKTGVVNKDKYYVYENGTWRTAANDSEIALGLCTTAREGVIAEKGNSYYICKSKDWAIATVLEYDTYGKNCLTDGSIVSGKVTESNKYVCDAGVFRTAEPLEIALNKGCVSYTNGVEIRQHLSSVTDAVYLCNNKIWKKTIEYVGKYGVLIDTRDNKEYKTVVIGSQTWMAENLNYADSINYPGMNGRSWCYNNSLDNCAKNGRLYNWAAAMDSMGMFSVNGKDCGDRKMCSPTYPVRGICPEGWHIPDSTEWSILYQAVGCSPYDMQAKGFTNWSKATDAYGFSAFPAGQYGNGKFWSAGSGATFWGASEAVGGSFAYTFGVYATYTGVDNGSYHTVKNFGHSIRCVMD